MDVFSLEVCFLSIVKPAEQTDNKETKVSPLGLIKTNIIDHLDKVKLDTQITNDLIQFQLVK